MQLRADMRYRTTTVYEMSLFNSTLDICAILNGSYNNKLFELFLDAFRNTVPKVLMSPCPVFGRVYGPNMTVSQVSINSQFPLGLYRLICHFFDDQDEQILTADHEVQVRNHMKAKVKKPK